MHVVALRANVPSARTLAGRAGLLPPRAYPLSGRQSTHPSRLHQHRRRLLMKVLQSLLQVHPQINCCVGHRRNIRRRRIRGPRRQQWQRWRCRYLRSARGQVHRPHQAAAMLPRRHFLGCRGTPTDPRPLRVALSIANAHERAPSCSGCECRHGCSSDSVRRQANRCWRQCCCRASPM